jgi:hypothetical protein
MTDFYALVKQQTAEYKALLKKEGVKGRYTRITLDLATAQTNQKLHIEGDYIGVSSITSTGTCKIRLDHRHSQEINLREVSEIFSPFGGLYFTTDGVGGACIIYVGGLLTARLKPIQGKVSIRNIAGSDVDLVTDNRFISHTGGHLVNTIGTPDTAERLSATSLKVKWGIIYTDLAIRYGFSSTVARVAEVGNVLAGGASLTVEYCDLYDLYIVNNVGAETPKVQVEYVAEA